MVLSADPPRASARLPRSLVAAMATGLAIRLALVLAGSGDQRFLFQDSDSYLAVARSLPRGLWDPSPTALPLTLGRPPAYPALAWAAGGHAHVVWVVLAQCLLAGVLNVWLGHRVAGRLGGPLAATTAAWVLALDPATIGHNLLVASETLAATLVLAALGGVLAVLDVRRDEGPTPWRPAIGAGAALAALVLTRPNAIVLLGGAAIVVAVAGPAGRRLALAGALLAAGALPLAAWVVRNDRVAGAPVLSTVLGQNLADFGVAAAATEEGRLRGVAPDLATFNAAVDPVARREHLAPPQGDTFSVATDRTWRRQGLRLVREHPRGASVVAVRGLARVVAAPGDSLALDQLPTGPARTLRTPSRVAASLWLLAVDLAALAGTVALVRRRRVAEAVALAGTAAAYLLASVGPFLYVRFRVPIVGPLAILAGVGLAAVIEWRRCGRDGDTPVHP